MQELKKCKKIFIHSRLDSNVSIDYCHPARWSFLFFYFPKASLSVDYPNMELFRRKKILNFISNHAPTIFCHKERMLLCTLLWEWHSLLSNILHPSRILNLDYQCTLFFFHLKLVFNLFTPIFWLAPTVHNWWVIFSQLSSDPLTNYFQEHQHTLPFISKCTNAPRPSRNSFTTRRLVSDLQVHFKCFIW